MSASDQLDRFLNTPSRSFFILWVPVLFSLVAEPLTGLVSTTLVPASGHLLFGPAWITAAMFQPFAALAFVTDGIHWGTGDFRFLRNVVAFATICSSLMIVAVEGIGCINLTLIWGITGLWIVIRAGWGIVRLWPGMKRSPLSLPVVPH